MSGLVTRFKLPVLAPVSNENSRSSADAMDVDLLAPAQEEEHADVIELPHVRSLSLCPTESLLLSQRRPFWNFEELHHTRFGEFCMNFIECFDDEKKPENVFYSKLRTIPRFAARFQRAAMALLASWLYVAVVPLKPQRQQETNRKIRLDRLEQVVEGFVQTMALELNCENRQVAARIAFDTILGRIFVFALRYRRPKLTEACLTFVVDLLLVVQHLYASKQALVQRLSQQLLPSVSQNVAAILKALPVPLELLTGIPTDIPVNAFDGSAADLFETDDRIRLYLSAPKRIPYPMRVIPESSAFAQLPMAFEDYTMPSFLNGATGEGGPSKYGDSASAVDFIKGARQAVTSVTQVAAGLLSPEGRSLLPLCAVSVLDRAQRSVLHNEDRWWLTTFINDAGVYDIEDIGNLFDRFKGIDFHRRAHVIAHASRYPTAVQESLEAGHASILTPNCKAMLHLRFQRSERRASSCPFASQNRTTVQEVRQLLQWQGVDLPDSDITAIAEAAIQGNQGEGCLMHYNALLKARDARARTRHEPIRGPPSFAHFQALRRNNNNNNNNNNKQ